MPNTAKLTYLLGKYLQQEYYGIFYSKCQNLARELRKAYDDALKKYDVIIMPTIPLKAPKIPSADLSLEGGLVVKIGSDSGFGLDSILFPILSTFEILCRIFKNLPISL